MSGDSTADCFVCRKHRDQGPLVPGGPVAEDELVLVSHTVAPDALGREGATAYLGHLLVEPRRHAPGLADLTDAEARAMGWWCARRAGLCVTYPGPSTCTPRCSAMGSLTCMSICCRGTRALLVSTGEFTWTSGRKPGAAVPSRSKP